MENKYNFKDYIMKAVEDLGFKEFTDIQKDVFNNLSSNKNILGESKTGSGKTHAFLIPIFNALDEDSNKVFATIIAPTKELASQIYKFAKHMASFSGKTINVKLYTGGTFKEADIEKLKNNQPHIVIGTPGRIKDLAIDNNILKIYTSEFFIVDEVDMIFKGGYQEELDEITNVLGDAKKMFFSATVNEAILPYVKKYMTNTYHIKLDNLEELKIAHKWINIKYKDRYEVLKDLISTFNPYLCLIFANKKTEVDEISSMLKNDGFFVGVLHGDLDSRERKRVVKDINNLKYQFVIATDIAARGIDIEGVSHIINFNLPIDYEFYIHRSGRTGRMYSDGIVYTLYDELDQKYLDNLLKKGIKPEYYDIKNKELVPHKNTERKKPESNYKAVAAKHVPLGKKKPGYKKRRQAEIDALAKKLEKKDKKKKRWY
ncbi:MAG: DEAD/DEAH box helicase [Acholeplasmatales bacterium]|nr:DEAD/DEAH box helicase [Acholeplasmatales bacterium]